MNDSKLWPWLDQAMSSLNPRNRSIAMVVDALVILACWHVTYLFRLGFERWQPGRPWYDDYVSFGVVALYLVFMALAGVPRGLWRFFGFDDFKRIAVACLLAGVLERHHRADGPAQRGGARRAGAAPAVLCDGAVPRAHGLPHGLGDGAFARRRVRGRTAPRHRARRRRGGAARRRTIQGRDGWTVLRAARRRPRQTAACASAARSCRAASPTWRCRTCWPAPRT